MKQRRKVTPIHLLAGGPGQPRHNLDALFTRVFEDAGHKNPTIAYVGAASDDDPDFFSWLAKRLRSCGAADVRLAPMAGPGADRAEARKVLRESNLVFVSGGDVEAGMRVLEATGLMKDLRQLHRAGIPFFGLSAGSIMLADKWIRWPDPDDDDRMETFACLGLAPIFCDTHGEDAEWEELEALLELVPEGKIGYGIPANAALRLCGKNSIEALGGPVHRFVRHEDEFRRMEDLLPVSA